MQNNVQHFDLDGLLAAANGAQTFQNLLPLHLVWQRNGNGYRAKKPSSYSIFCKNGTWLFKAHNGDYNNSGLYKLAAEIYKTTEFETVCALIAKAANLCIENYYTDRVGEQQAKPSRNDIQLKKWILENERIAAQQQADREQPTGAGENNPKTTPKPLNYAPIGSEAYSAAVCYFKAKTGVKADDLSLYGVYPLWCKKGDLYFAYKDAQGAKIKTKYIDITGKKTMLTTHNDTTKLYRFGAGAVVPTDKRKDCVLIVCEGEDDVICINNMNLIVNDARAVAVTFGGTSSDFKPHKKDGFFNDWKQVVICYDTDTAGMKASAQQAQKYDFTRCLLNEFVGFNGNDICDLYHTKNGKNNIETTLNFAAHFKKPTVYSPDTIHAHSDNKYINADQRTVLISALYQYKKVLAIAPTGAGKTYTIRKLLPQLNTFSGVKGAIIFVVPTTAILDQVHTDFNKENIIHSKLDSKTSTTEWSEAAQTNVIITTQNQLQYIPTETIAQSVLIIDEAHTISNDAGYRNETCNNTFDKMQAAKYTLCLTATAPKFYSLLGFQYVHLSVEQEQTKRFSIIENRAENKKAAILEFIKTKIVTAKLKNGKVGIFINDVAAAETYCTLLALLGIKATIFSSKNDEYKTDNKNYNSLIETGFFEENIDVFFFTSLFEAGVNIKENITDIILLSERASDQIAQIIARARHNGQNNKHIDISYVTTLDDSDNNALELEKRFYSSDFDIQTVIQNSYESVQNYAVSLNELGAAPSESELKTSPFIHYKNSAWQVATASLLHSATAKHQSNLTIYGTIKEIQEYDCTVIFTGVQQIYEPTDAHAVTAQTMAQKHAKVKAKKTARNTVKNDIHKAVFIAYNNAKGTPQAKEYKAIIGAYSTNINECTMMERRETTKIVERIFVLKKLQNTYQKHLSKYTFTDLVTIALNYDTDTDFRRFYKSLIYQLDQKANTDTGHFRREFLAQIKRNEVNVKAIKTALRRAGDKIAKTDDQAKEALFVFYDVRKEQDGIYTILNVRDALREIENALPKNDKNEPQSE